MTPRHVPLRTIWNESKPAGGLASATWDGYVDRMSQPQDKTARLAAALKANLARRKAQTRARNEAGSPDEASPLDGGAERDTARNGGNGNGPGEAAIVPDGKAR